MKIKRTSSFLAAAVLLASLAYAALKVGDEVPEVSAPLSDGTTFVLSEWVKKGPLVIYFYPKDDTPGCTEEACAIRNDYKAFEGLKATVVGVSYDSVESHKKFIAKHKLPFPLVADIHHNVAAAFGVAGEKVATRSTFIINKDGVIVYANPQVDPRTHSLEIRDALTALSKH